MGGKDRSRDTSQEATAIIPEMIMLTRMRVCDCHSMVTRTDMLYYI